VCCRVPADPQYSEENSEQYSGSYSGQSEEALDNERHTLEAALDGDESGPLLDADIDPTVEQQEEGELTEQQQVEDTSARALPAAAAEASGLSLEQEIAEALAAAEAAGAAAAGGGSVCSAVVSEGGALDGGLSAELIEALAAAEAAGEAAVAGGSAADAADKAPAAV
jgi:hypothetical protein